MNETGKIIRELREQEGFTQRSLANALHITDKAVSKWERGICLPDVSLLPKISLLLDVDINLLVSKTISQGKWAGLIDIQNVDFSQLIYDKPLVYYLLIHYQLLSIKKIYILTSKENEKYMKSKIFKTLGFHFVFNKPLDDHNLMIIDHPWFLFGSDLTQQFQGAMLSERNTKLTPENQKPVFYFSHGDNQYFTDKGRFIRSATNRTLGRGMICFDMADPESVLDVANFVRTYQKNSGMLVGSIEEVAYNEGILNQESIIAFSKESYGKLLIDSCKP